MNSQIESLRLIELHLRMHLTKICTFPVFDAQQVREDIEAHTRFVEIFLDRAPYLRDGEVILMESISALARSLLLVCNERLYVHNKISQLLQDSSAKQLIARGNFGDVNSSNAKFSDAQTRILDDWYDANYEHPYLNACSTEYLHQQTRLSHTQVKNWVSNKRRKEKNSKISKELESFLK
uniref:MAT homeobox alpha 2 protein n=1 Tax=Suhomyces choctaworum TaxID=246021 RepID=A0A3Q9FEL0_9ASCO|nr:MAT homeobox alpha 2 protein [Suhomyces choctaworum]